MVNGKKALVTGITGMDGSYLAELLILKGYEVYGMYRRGPNNNFEYIKNIKELKLVEGDLTDLSSMINLIKDIQPDEVYNLAAQTFVPTSWTHPIMTADVTGLGVLRILEAIRTINPKIKFLQASSSECFGKVVEMPQNENTPFYPRSPYGISKVFGYWITRNYRESYNMFACNSICFNHTGIRRGLEFVSRKITKAVANIKMGKQDCLELGNINSKRDFGHAEDYIYAMWLMMQQKTSDDFVIATGETHTIREFVELAFKEVGIGIRWKGKGLKEVGMRKDKVVVKVNPKFFRPAEVDVLLRDYSKAKKILKWKPKTSFQELIKLMVKNDMERI